MANSLTQNPWILDTAGGGILTPNDVKIRHIEFAGYALDTNQCIIQDALGRVIVLLDGAADLETVRTGNIGWVHGINLVTLTAGVCRIFLD